MHMGYTHTHKRFFSASTMLFLSLSTAYTFLPASLPQPHSHLRNHGKKCFLLHFPHLLPSHAFSAPSQQCACALFDVEVGGRESGGEEKLGAQGYNRKKRRGAKKDGEIGSSGVAHGERYLINTNSRSKLFRHPSLTRLWNATDG